MDEQAFAVASVAADARNVADGDQSGAVVKFAWRHQLAGERFGRNDGETTSRRCCRRRLPCSVHTGTSGIALVLVLDPAERCGVGPEPVAEPSRSALVAGSAAMLDYEIDRRAPAML